MATAIPIQHPHPNIRSLLGMNAIVIVLLNVMC